MISEVKEEICDLSEKMSEEDKDIVNAAEKRLEAITAKYTS